MRVQFWGTRGSLSKPGPTTLRYGGNTSCVEVLTADRTRIVLDCGTGAHGLGLALTASAEHPLRGHLLITHTHWGVELERVSRAGTVVDALARVVAIEALYHAVTLALEAEAASLST